MKTLNLRGEGILYSQFSSKITSPENSCCHWRLGDHYIHREWRLKNLRGATSADLVKLIAMTGIWSDTCNRHRKVIPQLTEEHHQKKMCNSHKPKKTGPKRAEPLENSKPAMRIKCSNRANASCLRSQINCNSGLNWNSQKGHDMVRRGDHLAKQGRSTRCWP